MVKVNICLKTLLQQGISEPVFNGDLVYTFKRNVGKPNLSDQFQKIIKPYKKWDITWISCNSLCLVVNPITVYSYWYLFQLHLGGSGLGLNGGPGVKLYSVCWCLILVVGWAHRSST